MLPKSIRWRLPLTYAAIALVAAVALGAVLLLTLRDYYAQQELRYMEGQAHAVGMRVRDFYEQNVSLEDLRESFPLMALFTQTRVQLFGNDGSVIADSGQPDEQYINFVYLAERFRSLPFDRQLDPPYTHIPDIFAFQGSSDSEMGIAGTFAIRVAPSLPTQDVMMGAPAFGFGATREITDDGARSIQFARAQIIDSNGQPLGYIAVTQGPAYGRAILTSVFNGWLVASFFAVVLAAGVGWVVSRRITAPLLALTNITGRMSQGDLSARVAVIGQDEVGFLSRSFNEMASRVEETVLALRRFVADAAHEIHTPLTALNTNLELAASESDAAVRLTFITRAKEELRRLEMLTTNLLNLSRLETSTTRDETTPIDAAALVRQTSELYASQAEQTGIAFQFDLSGEAITVHANESQLRCALENLLENALKFTPENGTITVGARQEGEHVQVWVQDSGIGIPPDDLPHVFSRFHRARNAAAYPGSGLGLAILKAVAERHHGKVKVESQLGRGTYFALQLPL